MHAGQLAETADVAGCMAALAARLGTSGVLAASDDLARYEIGARYGAGRAAFVARPASTEEVAFVVQTCGRHGVDVIPQGANTSLVGAATPDASGGQCVLSLERHSKTFDLNVHNRSVRVAAGTRLSSLNEKLAPHRLWFPIDLGADPTIGGMVATNTGGTRFIRYGDVRRNVLGLELVLPDGSILDLMDSVRKNNTGLDAKHLFVGTGGKLGIVTHAILEVHPVPFETASAVLIPSSDDAVIQTLSALEDAFGMQLTSFEGMSQMALHCAFAHARNLRNPFEDGLPDYALLVEISHWGRFGLEGQSLQETLEAALADILGRDLITNAYVHDPANLWSIRHHISDSLKAQGRVIALDVSVPRDRLVGFRNEAQHAVRMLADHIIVADFGHVGDGGLHFNMIWPTAVPFREDKAEALREAVYSIVAAHGGSFSAEHGVGPFNERYYRMYVSQRKRELETRIQSLLNARHFPSAGDVAAR